MPETRLKPARLGEWLLEQGQISAEQLKNALAEQKRTGRPLGKVLVENGYISDEQIARAIASQMGLPFADLRQQEISTDTVSLLSELQARQFRAIVLEDRGETYLVGLCDPSDPRSQDELMRVLRRPIETAVIPTSQFNDALDRYYRKRSQIDEFAKEVEREIDHDSGELRLGELDISGADIDAPVIKLLQTMFEEADRMRASDIHIEPQERKLLVRFRIDGVLYPQLDTDPRVHAALLVRLKLLAGLDISERRLPQDGRFAVRTASNRIDVRLSTMPTQYGESAVMRLLIQSHVVSDLDKLGMSAEMLEKFKAAITAPHGMVLVTGPTGSGKSTTLYCALQKLNQPSVKILTCEDPVEYRIAGVNQVQINEKIDLSYARVLRSFLRQDPDILLVGEIRDQETAEISARAAMTGHLVLSTLHTNDALSAPARLLDLGLPGFMIATTLLCVISQRLVRLICPHCAQPQLSNVERDWLRQQLGVEKDFSGVLRGTGCLHCNGQGFKGRVAVQELLEITPLLAATLHQGDAALFERQAREQMGGRMLRERTLELVLAGQTTVSEAMNIVTSIAR